MSWPLGFRQGFDRVPAARHRSRAFRARLIIAGDGPERASLTRQGIDAGLNSVEFIGSVVTARSSVDQPSDSRASPFPRGSIGLVAPRGGPDGSSGGGDRVGGLAEVVAHEETGPLVRRRQRRFRRRDRDSAHPSRHGNARSCCPNPRAEYLWLGALLTLRRLYRIPWERRNARCNAN
jgi:hypothetical protein